MKLLSKTSLLIITASIFIFWIGNIVFFFVAKGMIGNHINTELMSQMTRVVSELDKGDPAGALSGLTDELSINEVDYSFYRPPSLSDTVLYSSAQQKYIPHRALRFTYKSPASNREITIYKSLLSSDKLIERITLSSIVLVIAFIIMIFVLNRFIFNNVWSSFTTSLEKVEEYDIKNLDRLSLPESEIDEFDKLNRVLLDMVERLQSDYQNLKELTANTSHEIQTPLAIIKGKAEILLQSETLTEDELDIVNSILTTTGRLSKLNQSLLLIAKIENHQFEDREIIDLKNTLEGYINNMDLLFKAGDFSVISRFNSCRASINPTLLDVLVSNLLKNAVSHGTRGSELDVSLDNCVLTVSNKGNPLPFPDEQLFSRFIRDSGKKGGSGIGLEIVRKICNYYQIGVSHRYTEGIHSFSVDFSNVLVNE